MASTQRKQIQQKQIQKQKQRKQLQITQKTRRKQQITQKKHSLKGGDVIGSGGFGCIFRPALKCKNNSNNKTNQTNQTNDMISKLMQRKYETLELAGVLQFKSILMHIPNYEKYFLVSGYSTCEPTTLTSSDLTHFNAKCGALKHYGYTAKNVNSKLKSLVAINMPYGGTDLDEYDYSLSASSSLTRDNRVLKALYLLYTRGIVAMNKLGLFHCDLKGSNVLLSDSLLPRVIDWGLSIFVPPKRHHTTTTIPSMLNGRPFQYNMPYSVVLLDTIFLHSYSKFLQRTDTITTPLLKTFLRNYIADNLTSGQIDIIRDIFNDLPHNVNADKNNADNYVEEYLLKILTTFTKNEAFNVILYFQTVFLKNIDAWGYLTVYYDFFLKWTKHGTTNKQSRAWSDAYMYLVEHSDKAINIGTFKGYLNRFVL